MRRKMHNDDAVVQEIIDEVVDKFISEKKMFTLYDVTVEARNVVNTKITDRRVPIHHYGTTGVHDVILNSVNALIGGDADWDRQIITPKGLSPASKKPQLYYHSSCDPDMYEVEGDGLDDYRTQRKAAAAAIPRHHISVGGPALINTGSVAEPASVGHSVLMNSEHRITIPAPLLRKGGLNEGDEITVIADPASKTLILTTDHGASDAVATYHIDKRGSVRVSKGILNRAGLDGESFVVEEKTGGSFKLSVGNNG
jgi:bifunctional DNA-binding transcriptional regulator/antitoxin component of YhaV-PrlF toxin-antitoxin module